MNTVLRETDNSNSEEMIAYLRERVKALQAEVRRLTAIVERYEDSEGTVA